MTTERSEDGKIHGGDARSALNAIELGVLTTERSEDGKIHITLDVASECIQKRVVRYDKGGDNHYDTITAFIKSMRGSDPDAAVYYLAKMLYAGEDIKFIARRIMICAAEDVGNADPFIKSMRGSDPDAAVYYLAKMLYAGEDIKFIARRIMICAAEDVGNADPVALTVAVSAAQAVERIGMPEAQIILSQAVLYVATAPKSNSAVNAIFAANENVRVSAAQAVERIGMPEAQIILSQAVLYVATAPKSNSAVNAIFAANENVRQQYCMWRLRQKVIRRSMRFLRQMKMYGNIRPRFRHICRMHITRVLKIWDMGSDINMHMTIRIIM